MLSNFDQVYWRQKAMMKGKITQNEEMFNMYDKVLMDWEKQGMISRVEDYEPRRIGTYYHHHFGVF
jgi:hypothetical protein